MKTKYQGQLDEVGGKNTKSKALVYNDIANDINASMNSKKINSAQVKNKVSALKKKVNDIRDRNNATGGDFESDADDDLTQSLLDLYGNHPAQNPIVTFNPTTAPEEFLLDEENDDDEVEIMETGGERKIPNESLPVTRHEIFEVLDSSDNCKTAEDSEDQPQLVITTNNPDPVTPPARKSAVKSDHSSDKKKKSSRIQPLNNQKKPCDKGAEKKSTMETYFKENAALKKEKMAYSKERDAKKDEMNRRMFQWQMECNEKKIKLRNEQEKAKLELERDKMMVSAGETRTKGIVRMEIKGYEKEIECILNNLEEKGIENVNEVVEGEMAWYKVQTLNRKRAEVENLYKELDEMQSNSLKNSSQLCGNLPIITYNVNTR